jgi:hypothetical protein
MNQSFTDAKRRGAIIRFQIRGDIQSSASSNAAVQSF